MTIGTFLGIILLISIAFGFIIGRATVKEKEDE